MKAIPFQIWRCGMKCLCCWRCLCVGAVTLSAFAVAVSTAGFAVLEGPTWYNGRLYMSHIGYSDGVAQAPAEIVVLDDDNVIKVRLPY